MPFAVKWFDSTMRGAPTISGTAGSRIAALDACLITGFGPVTPIGITVSGGIATATLPSGQSFAQHAVVLVSGATPSALNGEARVLTTSSTQITFATTAADGAASGTIEIRYAPVGGWDKVFTGTNTAVYRSADVTSPRHYLRVDDTGTTAARVRGYESMTDVDTGTGPFPTDALMSGGGYWWGSSVASGAAVRWKLFADSRVLLPAIAPYSDSSATTIAAPLRGFGDPIALRPGGDNWCTFLSAGGSTSNAIQQGSLDGGPPNASSAAGLSVAPRAWQGLGSAVALNPGALTGGSQASGTDPALGAFPSEIDGELKISPMLLFETGKPPRARVPGVWHISQTGAYGLLNDGDLLAGTGDLAGRTLMCVATVNGALSAPSNAVYLVDITGPWR